MKFFLYIILIAYSLQLTAHSQKREQLITHWRGDKKTYSFTENGDWTAHKLSFAVKTGRAITDDRLIWKRNTLAGGDSSQIYASYSSTSGKTTFAITILQVDAEDLPGTDYVWDLEATDTSDTTDVTTLFDGIFRIKPDTQTRFDGVNIPPAGTRFHWAPLDSSAHEPAIYGFRNSDNSVEQYTFEELAESLQVAGISSLTSLETRFETDSNKVRFDISDSLSKNLVTEAYNLFSVTKQYPIEENIILFRQKEGVRIDSVLVVVSGTTPSLNFNLLHGTLASPDSLFSAYQTADIETGEIFNVNDFDEDTILVNEWVQISFNTISGVSSITAVFYWTPLSASTYVPVRISPSEFVDTYEFDNLLVDYFNGGGNIVNYSTGGQYVVNSGFVSFEGVEDSFYVDTTFQHSKFYNAYRIKPAAGGNFPKFVSAFEEHIFFEYFGDYYATDAQKNVATIGFWVDRTELNGNGLIQTYPGGNQHKISGSEIATKGFESDYLGTKAWKVVEVDGDFSYLEFYIRNFGTGGSPDKLYCQFALYNTSANEIQSITIYNPTLIYSTVIDPFYRYKSKAEKLNSRFIGKKFLLIGDSQYNDGRTKIELTSLTGAEIIAANEGGHRMAYSATSWFYEWTKRQNAMRWDSIDVYIFPISSNDNPGGNLRTTAIDSVEYFYPVYGDHPDTVTAKLTRFTALSEVNKASIFGYQQTYAAYIRSILDTYPTARIILCSIPISCGGYVTAGNWTPPHTAETVRAIVQPNFDQRKEQILELRDRYNLNFCDLMNEVGLTFENFLTYAADGVHWDSLEGLIKKRIAYSIFEELEKIK